MPREILIQTALGVLALQLPLIITAGIGFWFAARKQRVVGRVAKFAKWGFGLLIVYSLVSVILSIVRLQLSIVARTQSPETASQILSWLSFTGLVTYPMFIVGIILISRAVFLDR